MKLRRWCVTVMDNWTPTREFFTMRGALRHAARDRLFPGSVHLWRWAPQTSTWYEYDIAFMRERYG